MLLDDAIARFGDEDAAVVLVARLRWPDGPSCPRCGSAEHTFLALRRLWKCRACAHQYSAKAGTLFEGSPLGLSQWLPAVWAVANDQHVSSHELARRLGITQKSAWLMLRRIRLAMPPQ
jgi:transposase-like protein